MQEEGAGRVSTALAERIDPEARSRFAVRMIGDTPVLEPRLPRPFRAFFTTRLGGEQRRAVRVPEPRPALGGRSGCGGAQPGAHRAGHRAPAGEPDAGARAAGGGGVGVRRRARAATPCDGLTLNPVLDRELAAVLLFADCVPLVLCGEVDMAVAHGGWRGILGGIVQQAGAAMTGPPGAAVIGPSIGPCCFTVGEEWRTPSRERFGPEVVLALRAEPGGSPRVDLWEAATTALAEVGVPRGGVVNPRLCTVCNNDLFYSYRLEGPVTGRHGCVAWAAAA